jgi:hypothetical protein
MPQRFLKNLCGVTCAAQTTYDANDPIPIARSRTDTHTHTHTQKDIKHTVATHKSKRRREPAVCADLLKLVRPRMSVEPVHRVIVLLHILYPLVPWRAEDRA